MSLLTVPSLSNMPALSKSTGSDCSSAGCSTISWGPCTPEDLCLDIDADDFFAVTSPSSPKKSAGVACEQPMYDGDTIQAVELSDSPAAKTLSLSRAVAKAKRIAGKKLNMRRALRRGKNKVDCLSGEDEREDIVLDKKPSMISVSITQEVCSDACIADDPEPDKESQASIIGLLQADSSQEASAPALESQTLQLASMNLDDFESLAPDELIAWMQGPWTSERIIFSGLRLLFFVPWCIAVGGAMMFFPKQLDIVTFSPGYVSSERGFRRFQYWAHCAGPHVVIFAGFIFATLCWKPYYGILFAGAGLARFVYIWNDFCFDPTIPLGQDDKQSVYLAITGRYTEEDLVFSLGEEDGTD